MRRSIDRYVESLLRGRRPQPFSPTEDDVAMMRTAIDLAAAAPEGPREAFVEDLRRSLAASGTAAPRTRRGTARRRFLTATALTATAAAGVAAGRELTGSEPTDSELTPTVGTWQNVAADADLPEGAVLSFDLGTITGFLRRTSGRVQAVSGICTHQGCRLNLTAPRDKLACPCHGATFALTGEPLTHPHSDKPLSALPRLAVRVQQGRIQVYAPAPPA